MRVTKRTNIAIRVLMYCAVHPNRLVTKAEIAERCNASENHLAQVVNQLGQMDFLRTQRGRNGGLELGRDAEDITLGEVFRRLESADPINQSFSDFNDACPPDAHNLLRDAVSDAAESFYAHLDDISIANLLNLEGMREGLAPQAV